MSQLIFESKNPEETKEIAKKFLNCLENKKRNNILNTAEVVGLSGNLGSGKTTFTKYIGEILGVAETIQSPTFVLQKIYNTKHPVFKKIVHMDFYRIDNSEELKILKLEDLVSDPNNLVLIEWPEKANKPNGNGGFLPNHMEKIHFDFMEEGNSMTRKITYDQ
jgi:tRNA threonylcarbamoyladenosine biosynthesis protein TsaE